MSSSRGDFHPPALTEPYVKLSLHTALTMQPLGITALRFAPKSSRLVASLPYAAWFTPFAPFPLQKFPHYYGMIRPCGVRWYSMPCGDCPLDTLPSHHPDRFPRSIQGPTSQSRHVYAGGRLASKQVPANLVPELIYYPGFDRHLSHFDTSSMIHFRSTLR